MNFDFSSFLAALTDPRFAVFCALILGVVFVNGWTDAPNAITAVVCSGALSYRKAVVLAAVMNMLGLALFCRLGFSVGRSLSELVVFEGETAMLAIEASFLAILLFAVIAWFFGIPTSESHALCAALCGAASCLGTDAVNQRALKLVLIGAFLSCVASFIFGWFAGRMLGARLTNRARTVNRLEILGAMAESFLHGAQDGQKFLGVFFTGLAALYGMSAETAVPAYLIFLFCAVMALGTLFGGKRILKTVGEDMVSVDGRVGLCADLASGVALLVGTALGVPLSSTHTKTCAIMGAGRACGAEGIKSVSARTKLFLVWVLTFPVCFLLARFFFRLWMRV